MQRSHRLHWHPTLPVPEGILELSHLQKSSTRLKSSRKDRHTLHKPCFIEREKKKAAKRAGVRSAGRASCSRVASWYPALPAMCFSFTGHSRPAALPTPVQSTVLSIYCRNLVGGGFLPLWHLGQQEPQGLHQVLPNKQCPAPLLPHTSSFQGVWWAGAPTGAGGGSCKALSMKMPHFGRQLLTAMHQVLVQWKRTESTVGLVMITCSYKDFQ